MGRLRRNLWKALSQPVLFAQRHNGPICLIFLRPKLTLRELTGSTNPLLTEEFVGPCNKCHQIRRSDEASIFSINVRLGDRTGQRASRSYVEGDFVLYRFWNCLR
jgi:hypothetical protein